MEKENKPLVIFWFRRDLRLDDNHGLYQALKSGYRVLSLFIFDTNIIEKLEDDDDKRLQFIHQALFALKKEFNTHKSDLLVKTGKPDEIFKALFSEYHVKAVYCNHDYEPYALERDEKIRKICHDYSNAAFYSYKDQVVLEKNEVLKKSGEPYTVFTPYSKVWKMNAHTIPEYTSEKQLEALLPDVHFHFPEIEELGFKKTAIFFNKPSIDQNIIKNYAEKRDIPFGQNTSRLGVHLRFGTLSIRKLVKAARTISSVFENELIWREFYMMILWHFPYVAKSSFKPIYDHIPWKNDIEDFKLWTEGRTGYPLVDAGMRELKQSGFMHNRVRMLCASFLCKHLLIDWRWGEAWFARYLLDFELASNNGGWQWAAGTGCDAAPYFRIFNPMLQQNKFDKEMKYIKTYIPEINTSDYPQPIVDHAFARDRALRTYKSTLQNQG